MDELEKSIAQTAELFFNISELPEGAYTRYLKDIWRGKGRFEEWRKEFESNRFKKEKP